MYRYVSVVEEQLKCLITTVDASAKLFQIVRSEKFSLQWPLRETFLSYPPHPPRIIGRPEKVRLINKPQINWKVNRPFTGNKRCIIQRRPHSGRDRQPGRHRQSVGQTRPALPPHPRRPRRRGPRRRRRRPDGQDSDRERRQDREDLGGRGRLLRDGRLHEVGATMG